jgi:hypothetical protein
MMFIQKILDLKLNLNYEYKIFNYLQSISMLIFIFKSQKIASGITFRSQKWD